MTLRLHNTPTRKIESFTPLSDERVTLYTCGPTVYDYQHIGNLTAYIYWDILVRVIQANGYTVERVMNITDVGHLVSDDDDGEDKMQKGARREGKTAWEIADFYTQDFMKSLEQLNMILPTHIVKATEYISQQLDLVRTLKTKGFTYQIDDGIYFDTSKFPKYADFAGLDLEAQKAGARVVVNDQKHSPSDFALWKFSPSDEKRDMEWETPSDLLDTPESHMGFPGWHLECSAIAMNILGNTIDIHTGGIDHIPVHHTNEIAQSESATGQTFSRYWLHNNHLKVNGTKISKSLRNGFTLKDLEEKGFSPLDFRMFILQGHYTNEGNFTFENLEAAKNRLHHWRQIAALRHQTHDTLASDEDKADDNKTIQLLAANRAIVETLSNDLDTPGALAIIDDAFSRLDTVSVGAIHQNGLNQLLDCIDETLGLKLRDTTPDISDDLKQKIIERQHARTARNWKVSDEIRDELLEHDIALKDGAQSATWYYI